MLAALLCTVIPYWRLTNISSSLVLNVHCNGVSLGGLLHILLLGEKNVTLFLNFSFSNSILLRILHILCSLLFLVFSLFTLYRWLSCSTLHELDVIVFPHQSIPSTPFISDDLFSKFPLIWVTQSWTYYPRCSLSITEPNLPALWCGASTMLMINEKSLSRQIQWILSLFKIRRLLLIDTSGGMSEIFVVIVARICGRW